MKKIRILLVDDHAMIRVGLQMAINSQTDMEVVGQAGSGHEALAQARASRPDLVVLDVSLPDLGGTEVTAALRKQLPEVRVLAFTRHGDPGYLRRLLQAGATGYLVKNAAAAELINAIRVVATGGTYVDPSLSDNLLETYTGRSVTSPAAQLPSRALTAREREVLRLIAWGRSNKEIAAKLDISVKTVEYYKAQAVEKLHLNGRSDIVRYALAQGWLHPDQDPE